MFILFSKFMVLRPGSNHENQIKRDQIFLWEFRGQNSPDLPLSSVSFRHFAPILTKVFTMLDLSSIGTALLYSLSSTELGVSLSPSPSTVHNTQEILCWINEYEQSAYFAVSLMNEQENLALGVGKSKTARGDGMTSLLCSEWTCCSAGQTPWWLWPLRWQLLLWVEYPQARTCILLLMFCVFL